MNTNRDLRALAVEITAKLSELIRKLDEEKNADAEGTLSARLVMNPFVSTTSPVVKGTWVTVDAVMSLLKAKATSGCILRTWPELDVDDIRACVDHANREFEEAMGKHLCQSCGGHVEDAEMATMFGGLCSDCVRNNAQKRAGREEEEGVE